MLYTNVKEALLFRVVAGVTLVYRIRAYKIVYILDPRQYVGRRWVSPSFFHNNGDDTNDTNDKH